MQRDKLPGFGGYKRVQFNINIIMTDCDIVFGGNILFGVRGGIPSTAHQTFLAHVPRHFVLSPRTIPVSART